MVQRHCVPVIGPYVTLLQRFAGGSFCDILLNLAVLRTHLIHILDTSSMFETLVRCGSEPSCHLSAGSPQYCGSILPASDLDTDLECTALGVVFTKADVVCEYVTILAPTTEKAEVQFAVEGVTPISKVLQFEMSDGEPRLLVGTPTKSGDGITLLAGRSFRVKTTDVEIYAKEMLAAHETLQGDKILPVPQKRAADSMIQETPSKKFAPAFLVQ